jgi:hypothetical protein
MGPSIPENSLVFARAVLADYRATLATAPVTAPPGREWMFRLADALAMVVEDQADAGHVPEVAPRPAGAR